MKKPNNYTRGEEQTTAGQDDPNTGKKSEFSKKRPLPSIGPDKSSEFLEQSLCAPATMHTRQKLTSSSKRPQSPRMRDVPRPAPGRRSPPALSSPTHHGPCGDLRPRNTTDVRFKRDCNDGPYHRHLLLHPPWRTPCPVVDATSPCTSSAEWLPRGLKQLEPVDLCYRHGHRRRLKTHQAESDIADKFHRRHRVGAQQKAPKQRGDFNTRKTKTSKTVVYTIEEEVEVEKVGEDDAGSRRDRPCVASIDDDSSLDLAEKAREVSLRSEFSSTSLDECLETKDTPAPTHGHCGQRSASAEAVLQNLINGCQPDEHPPGTPLQLRQRPASDESIPKETEGTTDEELKDACQKILTKPHLVATEDNHICGCTVKRLRTNERPRSFSSMSATEETGCPQDSVMNDHALQREGVEEENPPFTSDSGEVPDPEVGKENEDDDRTVSAETGTVNNCETSTRDVVDEGNHDISPSSIKAPACDDSTSTEPPGTTSKHEIGLAEHIITPGLPPGQSCTRFTPDGESSPSLPQNFWSECNTPISADKSIKEIASSSSDRPKSEACTQTKELQEDLKDTLPVEDLLSFSVDSHHESKTAHTSVPDDIGMKPIRLAQANNVGRLDLNHNQIEKNDHTSPELQLEPSSPPLEDNSSCADQSQSNDQNSDLQTSLHFPDIAIGVKFFQTPVRTPVSKDQSDQDQGCRDVAVGVSRAAPESFTFRKMATPEDEGKNKYLVLPVCMGIDETKPIFFSMDHLETASAGGIEEPSCPDYEQFTSQSQGNIEKSSKGLVDRDCCSNTFTGGLQGDIDHAVSQQDTTRKASTALHEAVLHTENVDVEEEVNPGNMDGDDQHLRIPHKDKTGTDRRATTKALYESCSAGADERNRLLVESAEREEGHGRLSASDIKIRTVNEGLKEVMNVEDEGEREERNDEKRGRGEEGKDEEEWLLRLVTPVCHADLSEPSGSTPQNRDPERRLRFATTCGSTSVLRRHFSNLQGDGPWGQGDRIERPSNYVEPTVSLRDLWNRFYTDITPLDVAFNYTNIINSCSNSISYHSCNNQNRLLAALGDLKQDDVYKHALVCPLAHQCAAATKDLSEALYKVFRRYSNRARASQEALIEYCQALAAGKVTSPDALRQIEEDGKKLFMVWEAGHYVTRYADDAAQEVRNGADDTAISSTSEGTGQDKSAETRERDAS